MWSGLLVPSGYPVSSLQTLPWAVTAAQAELREPGFSCSLISIICCLWASPPLSQDVQSREGWEKQGPDPGGVIRTWCELGPSPNTAERGDVYTPFLRVEQRTSI